MKAKKPLDLDVTKLSKMNICFLLGINDQTLEDWYQAKGCPCEHVKGQPVFSLPKVFKWRLEYEKKNIKEINTANKTPKGKMSMEEAMRLDTIESYRKKKLSNDLLEGVSVNRADADNKFFELGYGIQQKMLNMCPGVSPVLVGLSAFEIETKLRKEIEKNLNEYAEEVK